MKKSEQQPIYPLTYGREAAAVAFGVNPMMIDTWLNREEDPLPHFREGRRILIPVKSAVEWIERQVEKEMNSRKEQTNGTDS